MTGYEDDPANKEHRPMAESKAPPPANCPGLALLGALWLAALPCGYAGEAASPASAEPQAQQGKTTPSNDRGGAPAAETEPAPQETAGSDAEENSDEPESASRTALNLLGQTDTSTGESLRNENVQFNAIDNNALRELNTRLGTTATIVREFQADRNYFGSEFGNPSATPLHLPDRTRAAGIHGSVYETHGNSVFSARSFFQVGDVQPAHENRYGFMVNAPLGQSTFLSVNGAQQKIRGNVNGNVLVPKPDERTPLTNDPDTRAIVETFLAAYPEEPPNRGDINPRALNTNSPQSVDTDNAGARFDHDLSARDRLSAQYRLTFQNVDAFQLVAGQNPDTNIRNHAARLTWTQTWSATTMTDFSAGFDRLRSLLVPEENAVGRSVSFGSMIEELGPGSPIPIDRAENRFRYAGQVRLVRGPHGLSTGFALLRRQFNGSEVSSHRGVLQFRDNFGRDALQNLLMGLPTRFSGALGDTHRGFRNWDMQFFAGDNWRVKPNWVLSMGLRYAPVTQPYEVNGLTPSPYPCDCNNLAGHFGSAYNLPGRWGVVRAGYGLHYADILPATYQQVRFNPPKVFKIVVPNPDLVDPLGGLREEDLDPNSRATVFEVDPRLVSPYSHQYNFTWESTFADAWHLQLGYVGSRSHKLFMKWYTNRARDVPGIPLTTGTVNDRRLDANHFDFRKIINASRGYFDAVRATLVLPRRRGLTMDASYWFSKAIDLGAGYTDTGAGAASLRGRNQSEDLIHEDLKGFSSFDQTHAFLWRITYELPGLITQPGWLRRTFGQWQVSTVALVKTGTPFTVISGSDAPGFGNVDGSSGDRPHIVDPTILGRTIDHPDAASSLLPAGAFAFMQPGESRGNLGRNTFRKDGVANVNAALSRNWSLSSDNAINFRAESINLFNTPQFAEPGRTLTAPDFGQITNTLNDGRTFRFALRFLF